MEKIQLTDPAIATPKYFGGVLDLNGYDDNTRKIIEMDMTQFISQAIIEQVQPKWDFNNIPKIMQAYRNWVTYGKRTQRYLPHLSITNNQAYKLDKLPWNVGNATLLNNGNGIRCFSADHGSPTTWTTYEIASKIYDWGWFNGIGFALSGTPFVFIDLDNVVSMEGEIEPHAKEILDMAMDSNLYIEVSPSLYGFHIFGNIYKDNLPQEFGTGGKKRYADESGFNFEVYKEKRFSTMTGHVYHNGNPENSIHDLLDFLRKKVKQKPVFSTPTKKRDVTEYEGVNVIGAFNDRFAVTDVLSMAGGYSPTKKPNRWMYDNSTSGLAGVHIYEDGRKLFSHHESDVLCDQYSHDAFDVYSILMHNRDKSQAAKAAFKELGLEKPKPVHKHVTYDTSIVDVKAEGDKPKNKITPFWYIEEKDSGQKMVIHRAKLALFVEHLGFRRLFETDDSENSILVRIIDDNKLERTTMEKLRDAVFDEIKTAYLDPDEWVYDLLKTTLMGQSNFISDKNLQVYLELDSSKIAKCKRDTCFFYLANGMLRINKNSISLEGYGQYRVWRKQVLEREFFPALEADIRKSVIYKFCLNVSGGNLEQLNALMIGIGYMLHTYRDPTIPKMFFLNDDVISENPCGGTGKLVLFKAIGKIRNLTVLNGKAFDSTKSFVFSNVTPEHDVVVLDDLNKDFNTQELFSILTGHFPTERKHKDAIDIPYDKSPKILATTNYDIANMSSSYKRRTYIFSLYPHYSHNFTPYDDFKSYLFDDWDDNEWNLFINFMARCAQAYLNNIDAFRSGEIAQQTDLTKDRDFAAATHEVFHDIVLGGRYQTNYKYITSQEVGYFKLAGINDITTRKYNTWLAAYADYANLEIVRCKSGNERGFILKEKTK